MLEIKKLNEENEFELWIAYSYTSRANPLSDIHAMCQFIYSPVNNKVYPFQWIGFEIVEDPVVDYGYIKDFKNGNMITVRTFTDIGDYTSDPEDRSIVYSYMREYNVNYDWHKQDNLTAGGRFELDVYQFLTEKYDQGVAAGYFLPTSTNDLYCKRPYDQIQREIAKDIGNYGYETVEYEREISDDVSPEEAYQDPIIFEQVLDMAWIKLRKYLPAPYRQMSYDEFALEMQAKNLPIFEYVRKFVHFDYFNAEFMNVSNFQDTSIFSSDASGNVNNNNVVKPWEFTDRFTDLSGFQHVPGMKATQSMGWFVFIPANTNIQPRLTSQLWADNPELKQQVLVILGNWNPSTVGNMIGNAVGWHIPYADYVNVAQEIMVYGLKGKTEYQVADLDPIFAERQAHDAMIKMRKTLKLAIGWTKIVEWNAISEPKARLYCGVFK